MHNNEQCNVVLRDVAKAFGKVWHLGLKYKITTQELPNNFTSFLCNFLDNREAKIIIGNQIGPSIKLCCGVPQGSNLSPTLYTIYTADMPPPVHGEYVAYADDVTQIIRHPGKGKQMMARITTHAIEQINEYEKKLKIKTNTQKLMIIHIARKNPTPITVNNVPIQYSNQGKILGLTITRTGIAKHVKQRKQTAQSQLTKLRRFSKMDTKIQLHLYKALIRPHLEYPPIPLNTNSKSSQLKLQAVQNKAIRRASKQLPPYTTKIQELHELYNIEPLNIRTHSQAQRVWTKLEEMEDPLFSKLNEEGTTKTHSWWPKCLHADIAEQEPLYTKR